MRSVQLEQLQKPCVHIHHGFSALLVIIGLSICQKFLRMLKVVHELLSSFDFSIFQKQCGLPSTATLPAQSTLAN
jgi:hypothetical protein